MKRMSSLRNAKRVSGGSIGVRIANWKYVFVPGLLIFVFATGPAFAQNHRNITYVQDMPPALTPQDLNKLASSKYTHVIVAMFHFDPGPTLVYNGPNDPDKYTKLWRRYQRMQTENNKKILIALGGWGSGTWKNIAGKEEQAAEKLIDFVKRYRYRGIDLDWEDWGNYAKHGYDPGRQLSKLISSLAEKARREGLEIDISLAPVASQLQGRGPLRGLYPYLQQQVGRHISWFNVQFYNGWGTLANTADYDAIISNGYRPNQIVAGCLSGTGDGKGYIRSSRLVPVIAQLARKYPSFGGVDSWRFKTTLEPRWPEAIQRAME